MEKARENERTQASDRLLGDLWHRVGLPQRARPYYLHALAFARDSENVSESAILAERLARVAKALGEIEEAQRWVEQARKDYQHLGDRAAIERLETYRDR